MQRNYQQAQPQSYSQNQRYQPPASQVTQERQVAPSGGQRNIFSLFDEMHQRQMNLFNEMTQGMMGNHFSGFGMGDDQLSPFGGNFMSSFDRIENELFNAGVGSRMFGSAPTNEQITANGGNFVSQQFCYSKTIGEDGKPRVKKYFSNDVRGIGSDGQQVGERQEMYHNSSNHKKIVAQERTLGQTGKRIVKQKIGDGIHPH